jgi:hypothetical protein
MVAAIKKRMNSKQQIANIGPLAAKPALNSRGIKIDHGEAFEFRSLTGQV